MRNPLRTRDTPVEVAIAAAGVDDDPLRIGHREAITLVLAAVGDGARSKVPELDVRDGSGREAQRKLVTGWRGPVARPGCDKQIGAGTGKPDAVLVAGIRRPHHHRAVGVQQKLATAPGAGDEQIGNIAGRGVDREDLEGVAGIQCTTHLGVEVDPGGGGPGIDQAEIEGLTGCAVDGQRVVAGDKFFQPCQTVVVVATVAGVKRTVGNLLSTRPGERPVEAVFVAAQGVKEQDRVCGEREVVDCRRCRRVQRAQNLAAHGNRVACGQRVATVVRKVVEEHVIAAIASAVDVPFNQ